LPSGSPFFLGVALAAGLAALSKGGFPPLLGFVSKEYVYKGDLRKVRQEAQARARAAVEERVASGMSRQEAAEEAQREAADWLKAREAEFNQRYERELMNPREALSLGSISEIVMPADLRASLAHNLTLLLRRYQPGPWQAIQREFH